MSRRAPATLLVAAALLTLAAGGPAAAQPAPAPGRATGGDSATASGPAGATRPAARPAGRLATPAEPARAAGPPPLTRPAAAQGALTPPEPSLHDRTGARGPDRSPDGSGAAAGPGAQASQGALIPPEPPATPVTPGTAAGALVPSDAGAPPAEPAAPPVPAQLAESDFDAAACRLGLTMLGVRYQDGADLPAAEDRDCGIARPVTVTEILPGVALAGPAAMRCATARQLALWTAEAVRPAAARLPGAPTLTGLDLGTTYQCRAVVGGASAARLSEHATGNAIDIAAFRFADGSRIEVAPPADRGDLAVAFQNAVQATACLYFTTVLGPGSNAAHDDHLHLDIKARRGEFRLCQ